jgi:diamine N-acetyltransferase
MRNPVMVGDRVYLRPFEVEDVTVLFEADHQESDTFMERGRNLSSTMETRSWIERMYDDASQAKFAVCVIETDECIGLCGLEFIDLINGVAETGTRLHNPAYRNRGYGTEAKHLVLEYAFERLHLERIISHVFEPNTRSATALRKQGYQPAGRLRYDGFKSGQHRDALLFDLTHQEWQVAQHRWRNEHDKNSQTSG